VSSICVTHVPMIVAGCHSGTLSSIARLRGRGGGRRSADPQPGRAERRRPRSVTGPLDADVGAPGGRDQDPRVDPRRHRLEGVEDDLAQGDRANRPAVSPPGFGNAAGEAALDAEGARLAVEVGAVQSQQLLRSKPHHRQGFGPPGSAGGPPWRRPPLPPTSRTGTRRGVRPGGVSGCAYESMRPVRSGRARDPRRAPGGAPGPTGASTLLLARAHRRRWQAVAGPARLVPTSASNDSEARSEPTSQSDGCSVNVQRG
jgi:hypothetical protein